jgi:hypothetical protein
MGCDPGNYSPISVFNQMGFAAILSLIEWGMAQQ